MNIKIKSIWQVNSTKESQNNVQFARVSFQKALALYKSVGTVVLIQGRNQYNSFSTALPEQSPMCV